MPTALAIRKTSLPKSQDAVALQQIKESVALYPGLIVVISVRQSTVAAISGLHCRALVMVVSSISRQPDCKNSKKWRNGQRDMCMSRVAIISALVICITLRLSWAVNRYRDNAITYKAQRDKNARELKLANAAITDMQMRQRDVAALDAKYTKSYWCCAENRKPTLPLVVVGCTSAVCQSVREATTASAWIMQPPPDWQTPLNGITTLWGWSLCKTTGRNPEVY